MEQLSRFTVSISSTLLEQLDSWVHEKNFPNRSEGLRQIIREKLAKECWDQQEGMSYGSITLMYDHHRSDTLNALTSLQHDYEELIVCSTHVHLDHKLCLEVLVIRGEAPRLSYFVKELAAIKGILTAIPAPLGGIGSNHRLERTNNE